jgi:hypothetical protein
MAIGAIIMIGLSLVQSLQEQSAIEDQAEAEQNELTRQQEQANTRAQEDRSERAIAADRQMASITAGFEATGGGMGSGNAARALQEEGGAAGLDLARIEGNRRREVGALQSEKKSSAQKANAEIQKSQLKFLGSAASAGTGLLGNQAAQSQASGFVSGHGGAHGPSSSQLSSRSTISLGSRAQ